MGKNVLTQGKSCYSNMSFVKLAKKKSDYFSTISNILLEKPELTDNQLIDALKCYYLTQCCNWLHTDITPQQYDFNFLG